MAELTRPSPQERIRCACPRWTTARECMHLRYAPDDAELHSGLEQFEDCQCPCHHEDEED